MFLVHECDDADFYSELFEGEIFMHMVLKSDITEKSYKSILTNVEILAQKFRENNVPEVYCVLDETDTGMTNFVKAMGFDLLFSQEGKSIFIKEIF